MAGKVDLSGNEAIAIALRQINPGRIPAFPITHHLRRFHSISLHFVTKWTGGYRIYPSRE